MTEEQNSRSNSKRKKTWLLSRIVYLPVYMIILRDINMKFWGKNSQLPSSFCGGNKLS